MDNQVSHHNDVLLALRDCKNKIDKIPGLLAEIARLRGSSRASVKSLNEQDQFLKQFKLKIKQLEVLTGLLTHSLIGLLTYSLTHALTHSLMHLLTHLLTHSLTYSLTYLLTH